MPTDSNSLTNEVNFIVLPRSKYNSKGEERERVESVSQEQVSQQTTDIKRDIPVCPIISIRIP